jgi:acetyl esterase/lipase
MAVVHELHDRRRRDGATMNAMEPDDDRRPPRTGAKVLPIDPAPDGMELRHLRAFVAVAEELNFGRAAARLFVSQPALSRQVRALERLIGCELLRRSTHRVELTVAGEALLERAHRLLGEVDDAIAATRAVGGEVQGRLDRIWAPIQAGTDADNDLQALRNVAEDLHAQFPLPDVAVRAVNAGGVPAFVVRPDAVPAGEQPTLLFFHGGGYVLGSAFGYRHLAGAMAVAAGAPALVPEYRLAPEYPFPAALDDARRAYGWLLDTGVPAGEVVVAGDSAGAGLTMSLLLQLRNEGLPMPGGAVLMSPALDLNFGDGRELPAEEVGLTADQLRSFAAAYLGDTPVDDELVAPLGADLTGLPPLLVQGATGDMLVEDAKGIADRAEAHGVEARLELYPVATHDFQVFWSFLPEAADAIDRAGRFAHEVRDAAPARPTEAV